MSLAFDKKQVVKSYEDDIVKLLSLLVGHSDQELLKQIDKIYTRHPYYGYRRMRDALKREGLKIGKKRTVSAMKYMGLRAIYPEPKTTIQLKNIKNTPTY